MSAIQIQKQSVQPLVNILNEIYVYLLIYSFGNYLSVGIEFWILNVKEIT